jgi:opacity protein-like surface antigen
MRKSVWFSAVAALAAIVSLPSGAHAQAQPPAQGQGMFGGKVLVSANIGIQVGDNDLARQSTFPLYDENAVVDIQQTINNGFFFELGGSYKLTKEFGVGLAWGFLTNAGEGRVSGSLPHPILFDQPRSFDASVDDLKHSENSFHFQAVYFMPFTDKVDFMFSGGPSLFVVKQALIRSVLFSETPPFTSVTIDSVDIVEPKDSAWGFHLGADMIYAVTPSIGVGALVRYSRGTVEFNLSDTQTADVKAGGFQLGGGVRLKF